MSNTDWAQKYRPQTIEDMVLPKQLQGRLTKLVKNNGGMSLLFHGRPGSGKTTIAKMISPDNTLFINCTTNNSIDMVRGLERSCSSVTLDGKRRVVVLDEADYLSKDAQAALRGTVEFLSSSNDFIMTANEPDRLTEAIRSRFLPIHFDFLASTEFKAEISRRLRVIAVSEGRGDIEDTHIRSIVTQYFPDIRRMIKTLQFELMANA